MGSHQNRFPLQDQRWKGCGGCWSGFSCFNTQKGGKRIVPSSRIPEAQPNGTQGVGRLTNQPTTLGPSILAPPSSPASFINSALPSTPQSPTCCLSLSANSPCDPSSTMFETGPYAHETQLVSPPVFSTFTTEPSTAPLTPPPELNHLTTPSSPDVPFARFLSSVGHNRKNVEHKDYVPAYSLYPGSPSGSSENGKYSRSGSGRLFRFGTSGAMSSQDANFFCPDTYAQFYRDNPPFPNASGRLSVSKDSDAYGSNGGSSGGQQNRHGKNSKQEVEETEAYRASFGFSADEIVTTPHYVEISDGLDDTFTITPLHVDQPNRVLYDGFEDDKSEKQVGDVLSGMKSDRELFGMNPIYNIDRKYNMGLSSSDAEIDYRRGRSKKEEDFAWRDL